MNADQIRNLEFALESASKRVKGAAGKSGQAAENAYGEAYQQMVRAGLKPQLRHKYRVPKG